MLAFFYMLTISDSAAEEWLVYVAVTAFFGLVVLLTGWECFFAPPRVIIDEVGVGGRFTFGGFVGTTRIAWDDIIGARFSIDIPSLTRNSSERWDRTLALDVDNDGGKYYRARKKTSPEAGRDNDDSFFAFDITYSNISDARAKEIAVIINSRAKAAPREPQESSKPEESGKSPFAAD